MSLLKNLPQDRESAFNELDIENNLFHQAIEDKNLDFAVGRLRQFFKVMRYSHSLNIISRHDMEERLNVWKGNIVLLFAQSPNNALVSVLQAYDLCEYQHTHLPCDKLIANTVFVCLNTFVKPALLAAMRGNGYISSHQVDGYVQPIMNVMKVTARHTDSPQMQDTFYEAMTEFEGMLFSNLVPPVKRFEYVHHLSEWAKANQGCERLAYDMAEILEQATFLPNGCGMIQLQIEEDAYLRSLEEAEAKAKEPVDIRKAFTIRAGVADKYEGLYLGIDKALKNEKWPEAQQKLFKLFAKLAQDSDDQDNDTSRNDVSTMSYFLRAAEKLSDKSPSHGFQLATHCIDTIERECLYSEPLMNVVYGFALPVVTTLAGQDSKYTYRAKEIYKIIMRRSSEFERCANAGDIFDCAGMSFREYLSSIPPVDRYVEVEELSIWLGGRKVASEMLGEFVDDLMNSATNYGNYMGIPLEEDEDTPLKSAEIKAFPVSPMQPLIPV